MAADWHAEDDPPGAAGDVLLVDARPAVLVAQLGGPDGHPYLTSRSLRGSSAHAPLAASTDRSSYRVTDLLTVDADRTSAFVAVALDDGSFLVVAMNEGVVVTPNHFGARRVPLAPHEAFVAGPDDLVGSGRVVSPWAVTPSEEAEVADVLDRVAELVRCSPSVVPPGPGGQASPVPGGDPAADGEESGFGHYLLEMLLTGVAITVVLVVLLLVLG